MNIIRLRGKLMLFFGIVLILLGSTLFATAHFEASQIAKQSLNAKINADSKLGYSLIDEKYKGSWSIRDGKLYKGNNLINDDYSIVDEITKQTESFATIFMHDTRISTSVLKEDGSRAVGTKVSEPVKEAVLKQGKEYLGEAVILNKEYYTKYIPLKDDEGNIIGIWFVGTEKEKLNNLITRMDTTTIIAILLLLTVGIIILAFFVNSISKSINAILRSIRSVASGDLTNKVHIKRKDEIGDIANNVNTMIDNVGALIKDIKEMSSTVASSSKQMKSSAEEVSKASEQIAVAVSEVAKGATEQAVSTEKGNRQIVEIVEGLGQIAEDMVFSEKLAYQAKETLKTGEMSVKNQEIKVNENTQVALSVSNAISDLSKKSNQIGQILEVIQGIAEQTNLLALNAAIEAARAGEAGRGFSVVADEIRKLAEQSSLSVREINQIINEVKTGIDHTVTQMDRAKVVVDEQTQSLYDTVNAFGEISKIVVNIAENIQAVSKAANHLSKNAMQAGDSISYIASISQETAAGTEEVSASTQEQTAIIYHIAESAENLWELADKLQTMTKSFNI
ncbi:MAG TPA: methyl-accepting chemotaxis protein [Pseudobacteroides sp.]|nr:methyl-accepting chemotaxis protein [Pseudobacteroides sp.]